MGNFHKYIQPRLKADPEFRARYAQQQAESYQRHKAARTARAKQWRENNPERWRELGRQHDERRRTQKNRHEKFKRRYERLMAKDPAFNAIEQQRRALHELVGAKTPYLWTIWPIWPEENNVTENDT